MHIKTRKSLVEYLVLFKKLGDILSEKGLYGLNKRTSLLVLSAFFLMFVGFPIAQKEENETTPS